MPAKNKTIKCNDGTLYTTGDNDGKKKKNRLDELNGI